MEVPHSLFAVHIFGFHTQCLTQPTYVPRKPRGKIPSLIFKMIAQVKLLAHTKIFLRHIANRLSVKTYTVTFSLQAAEI